LADINEGILGEIADHKLFWKKLKYKKIKIIPFQNKQKARTLDYLNWMLRNLQKK